MKRLKKGFTLIELLVVIAIIGILASIVLINVGSARNRARLSAVKAAVAQVGVIYENNIQTNGNYIPATDSKFASIVATITENNGMTPAGNAAGSTYRYYTTPSPPGAWQKSDGTPVTAICTDSTGIVKEYTGTFTPAALTTCPPGS